MKKIKEFFAGIFSKLVKMENKGVAVLFGVQMALCLTAAIVAIVVALSLPTGTPPEGADTGNGNELILPESLSFCYVTFDTDGGGKIAKQRVWRGDVPIEPKEPKKDGFYFSGWTKDGEPYDFTEAVSADTKLVASWSPMLTCIFDYGDGGEAVTISCKPGDTISAPKKNPSRADSYFVGWSVDGELWSFDTAVTESMTLTPSYSTTAEIILASDFSPFLSSYVTLDKEYSAGVLKPVYSSLSERFDVVFKSHASDSVGASELILGSVSELSERGASDKNLLLDFRDYLDKMPNLSAYLNENPTVFLSLFASSRDKSLYAIPIPEIYKQPSALPLLNSKIITELLDGDEPFDSIDTEVLSNIRYYPSSEELSAKIKVPVLSEGEISYFTKPTDRYGNILMNYDLEGVPITGERAVNMLREYIDLAYGDMLERRSDLFLGEGAMYDTSELIALLRCVMLNRETLGLGTSGAAITVTSYDELLILTEMLFGVRGISSDSTRLYFDGEGTLIDPRINENSYIAVSKMRSLIAEGLVKIVDDENAYRDSLLTLYISGANDLRSCDEDFSVALPPLAYYSDFSEFTRYISSVDMYSERAISVLGAVKNDSIKLNAILLMVDYLYTDEGRVLINLGGGDFCDGDLASELSRALSESLSAGDYKSYLRDYLGAFSGEGSYISFGDMHSDMLMAVENYLALGMIKSPNTLFDDDYLYSYVPDRISITDYNEEKLSELTEITSEAGEFSFENENNVFVKILTGDFTKYENCVDYFLNEIGGREYLTIIRRAVGNLKTYYHSYSYS